MKASRLLPLLTLIGLASLVVAISVGSTSVRLVAVLQAVLGGQDSVIREVILDLRLPRALNAFSTGGLLALAGVLMQVLLRNPLADPYVLGISGGAAVAALGAMLLGFGGLLVDWAAGMGALGATLLVFALAHARGGWTPQRLLLNGVVVASGCAAVVSLMPRPQSAFSLNCRTPAPKAWIHLNLGASVTISIGTSKARRASASARAVTVAEVSAD